MSANGQINIRMSADLKAAAEQIKVQRQVQQEMADQLGVTRSEYIRIEREIQKKQAAERKATAVVQQHTAAQKSQAVAARSSSLATAAAGEAMSALGISANAALGPLGLAVGALTALGAATYGATSRMSAIVDEVALLAEGTGLSQTQVIALQHAVSAAGGDINKTKEALSSFNRVMQSELAGKTGPEVDRVLRDTIARIEAIPDPAGRAAERMRVFGTESARALAGLTSGGLAQAERETQSLALAVKNAAGSSADMDESAANLNRAVTELTVVLGDKLAPSVVRVTDLLAGLADATTAVTDSVAGQAIGWSLSGGFVGMYADSLVKLETAMNGPARMQAEFNAMLEQQRERLKARREEMEQQRAEEEIWLTGWTPAPARVPGRAAATPAQRAANEARRRAAEEEEAQMRRREEEIGRMRREVEQAAIGFMSPLDAVDARMNQELQAVNEWLATVGTVPEAYEIAEQRRIQIMQEAANQRAQIQADEAQREADARAQEMAQYEAAHMERMRRLDEERAAQQQLIEIRRSALTAAASGISQLVEASSAGAEAVAAARILETLAYGSVAFARALAELGPVAGIPVAISTAAAIGSQIAAVQSAPSRHMGGPAPDEGIVRVRNNERVTFEPATKRRGQNTSGSVTIAVDNQTYRAWSRRSDRQDSIFGNRRRESVEVGE